MNSANPPETGPTTSANREHPAGVEGPSGRWSADAEIAYDAMARVYDAFTAHHDFELWFESLLPKLEQHGLVGKRLLDVACGTGHSFLPMRRRGWHVTASDISSEMVAEARTKIEGNGDITLTVADMRELPLLGEFDLVWALGDAVNYLLDYEELGAALTCLGGNLAPTGLLVFDTNTLLAYRTFFAEEIAVDDGEDQLTWTGITAPTASAGVLAEARFSVRPAEPCGLERPPILHRERHHPEATVRAALDEAGLRLLGVYGHHYDAVMHEPVDESRDIKTVYIAARRSREGAASFRPRTPE